MVYIYSYGLPDPSELFWVIFVSVYELKGEEDENGL